MFAFSVFISKSSHKPGASLVRLSLLASGFFGLFKLKIIFNAKNNK
jgi:hypothetical protein